MPFSLRRKGLNRQFDGLYKKFPGRQAGARSGQALENILAQGADVDPPALAAKRSQDQWLIGELTGGVRQVTGRRGMPRHGWTETNARR